MSNTHVVSASFPTLGVARAARKRLAGAGFARNSMDIERHRDAFEVLISTRDENRARAERVLRGHSLSEGIGDATRAGRAFVHENGALSIGLAALAGFLLYALSTRRRA